MCIIYSMFSPCLLTFCIVHRINGMSSDRRRFDFRPEDIDILHYCVVKRLATDAQTHAHAHTLCIGVREIYIGKNVLHVDGIIYRVDICSIFLACYIFYMKKRPGTYIGLLPSNTKQYH